MPPAPLQAIKSFRRGSVSVRVDLRSNGYGNASVKAQGHVEMTTTEARQLASALISLADAADARHAQQTAKDAARAAYQKREIAAGRMKVLAL